MGHPHKGRLSKLSLLPYMGESVGTWIIFISACVVSLFIDPTAASVMFIPGVILVDRKLLIPPAISLVACLAALLFLLDRDADALSIVIVHVLFYGVITWYKAQNKNPPRIDPEPIFLLLLHTAVSVSMLSDSTTTVAMIVVVVSGVVTFGDYDLPTERVAVFVASILSTVFFGHITASIASIAIGVVIIFLKLRPLKPSSLSLVGLGSLALSLLANKVVGSIFVFVLIGVVTGLFVINRAWKPDVLRQTPPPRNISTHPNGYLPMSNPTESLDLHGHSVTGAMKVLHTFLREREDEYRKNRSRHIRFVTIITGDGNNGSHHDTANLVKPTVVNFLKINKYKYDLPSDSPGLIKIDLESHAL